MNELSIGSDWRGAIDDALATCDAVVVVGSATALASSHCRDEWRAALATGKLVVVGAIEAVSIPAELCEAGVLDLRRAPDRAMTRLADALAAGAAAPPPHDDLPALVLPGPMRTAALLLGVLCAFQLALLIDMVASIREEGEPLTRVGVAASVAHVAILAAWIAYTVRWSYGFVRREGTDLGLMAMTTVPFAWTLHSIFMVSDLWWTTFVAVGVLSGLAWRALGQGLGRWTPLSRRPSRHAARAAARAEEILASAAAEPACADPAPLVEGSYTLYAAPQDVHVARYVDQAMGKAGLRRLDGDAARPATRIVLLSNATDLRLTPLTAPPDPEVRTICIVASSVAIPDDLDAFHGLQWLDFRDPDPRVLEPIASWLANPSLGPPRSIGVDPPHRVKVPGTPGFFIVILSLLALAFGLAVLLPLIESAVSPSREPPGATVVVPLAGALLAALVAAVTRARAVTLSWFLAGFLGVVATVVAAVAIVGTDFGFYVTLLVPVALLTRANIGALREWFLAAPLSWRRPTLAAEPLGIAVVRYVLITFLLTVAISVMGANADALN